MENYSADPIQDENINSSKNEEANSRNVKAVPKQGTGTAEEAMTSPQEDAPSGEVNMEATITSEDVIRAGGFGARDDMSSFLPVASDSTDFEETLLDAWDYEEPQVETRRPGLGWKDAASS